RGIAMPTALSTPTDTRLLIESATKLRENAKKLVREAKTIARKLNHSRRLSEQLLHAYNEKADKEATIIGSENNHHFFHSPLCSCVSITLPAESQTRITVLPKSLQSPSRGLGLRSNIGKNSGGVMCAVRQPSPHAGRSLAWLHLGPSSYSR